MAHVPSSSKHPASRDRTLPVIPRRLLDDQVGFALLVWGGYAAFVVVVTLTVSYFRAIEVSGWDLAKGAVPWYVLFIGIYLGWSELPLNITHGRTRADFMRQVVVFVGIYAAAIAAMVTVTFVAEAGLYRVAGWPQEVAEGQFFDSALQLPLILLQSWLTVALWTAGGFFIGAAWYRSEAIGGLAIAVAIVFAGIAGISVSGDWGPFGAVYEYLFGEDTIGGPVGVLIHLALIAAVIGMAWPVVRDISIRNKEA